MGEGTQDIIKIGIILLIVVVIVGLVFGLLTISRGTANEGVVQVQSALGDMQSAKFQDYDQKTVSGTQVLAAYNEFVGNNYAVIVKTVRGSWVNYNALVAPFTSGSGGESRATAPFTGISLDPTSKQYISSVSYYSQTATSTDITLVLSNAADEDKKTIMFNNITTAMKKAGGVNYVVPTAKFSAYLIRDASDQIVGICFIQQGKHTT